MNVFVYGLLQPGKSIYPRIEPFVRSATPAFVGGQLADIGAFPALLDTMGGRVLGWLLEIHEHGTEAALCVMDGIEGYCRNHPSSSMYLRRTVNAITINGSRLAEAYFWNAISPASDRLIVQADSFDRVELGEWDFATAHSLCDPVTYYQWKVRSHEKVQL